MKKLVGLFSIILFLAPVAVFAQGGPFFDNDDGHGYGGTVTVCFHNETRTVNANQARELLRRGATAGPCAAPGTLTVVKNSVGGNGSFDFTITPRNGGARHFTIDTVQGAGSSTMQLAPGTYSVAEDRARGWDLTSNTCSNVVVSSSSTLTCTVTNTIRKASISGTAYLDINGNGHLNFFERVFNKEPGVTVYLDTNNNKQLDSGEPTQTTNSSGFYQFTNLDPNKDYYVREVVPAGYTETIPHNKNKVYHENPNPGEQVADDDFGNFKGSQGRHWWDWDGWGNSNNKSNGDRDDN